ncbi:MAG TPA: arsenic resistance N-acetyltransferase ArsN2 [Gemmatimonadales bacterium]|nr:arsenic resistance N-acetyltransferase ArsN2 [Gemmatimonadales bacterium]
MTTQIKNGQCVELRAAGAEDLPVVMTLLGKAKLPTAGVEDPSHYIVAESEGRLVGVVGLEVYGDSALLRSTAVEQDWQRTGVGRVLVEKALELARDRGLNDVFLLTTTAEHYFPRFGFACVSRDSVAKGVQSSIEFREACPVSATVMRKSLRETASP